MLSGKLIRVWLGLLLIAMVTVWIGSCSDTKPEGPDVKNNAPKIEIVNIPPNNSHFTTNPLIYWYGTDVDGKIVIYEYAVVPAALLLTAGVDTSNESAILNYATSHITEPSADKECVPESCWQQIDVERADNPNEQTIRLYADPNPSVNTLQYFFVRAVDNDSARSNIDYRLYSRANHPPETVIKTTPDTLGYYDLSDTSSTYKGIYFEWKGTDKIDYPDDNQNPVFEYFWQVFGPYQKNEIFGTDSLGNYAFDYTKVDTTQTSKLVMMSHDSVLTQNVWVTKTSTYIYGLWNNQPPSDTTRSGYFVLKVTARDDAFVSDTLPEYVAFFTIDAHFEKDLLVYVPFYCVNSAQLGGITCGERVDSMMVFYRRVISSAGYPNAKMISSPGQRDTIQFPSKLELAHYKVFLLIDDGQKSHLKVENLEATTPYLDLGGSVWFWALSPFGSYYTPGAASLISLASKPIPKTYFDVVGEFSSGWVASYMNRWTEHGRDSSVYLPTNEEFLGGIALAGTGMPDFDEDSAKYSSTYIAFDDPPADWRAAPHTNYFQRYGYSEPLWLYRSFFGDFVPDSLKGYVTGLQGRVIGLRYDEGMFKTAVYGFSMYMLPEEKAKEIFRLSMAWFLDK